MHVLASMLETMSLLPTVVRKTDGEGPTGTDTAAAGMVHSHSCLWYYFDVHVVARTLETMALLPTVVRDSERERWRGRHWHWHGGCWQDPFQGL